jgi:hypothetical protein
MAKAKYSLTDADKAALPVWTERCIKAALRTGDLTAEEIAVSESGVVALYAAAKLPPPRVVWCDSPLGAAVAAGIARQALHIRDQGAKYTDGVLLTGVYAAVRRAVVEGMDRLGIVGRAEVAIAEATRAAREALGLPPDTQPAARAAAKQLVNDLMLGLGVVQQSRHGGNQWAGWTGFLSFFDKQCGLDLPEYKVWRPVAAIQGGPRYAMDRFCIISRLPTRVLRDVANRPHAEGQGHIAWRDGWELGYWHGTAVPLHWLTDTANVDVALCLTHPNVEQRRALCEIVGWKRVLERCEATVVNTDKDPEIGTLLAVDLPDAPKSYFLRVKCGTGRDFVLSVPNTVSTALEANAWTYGLDAKSFNIEVRT